MPVVLRIPAQDVGTRTPGDPGLPEVFNKPEHAYVWLVMTNNSDEVTVNYRYWQLNQANWILEPYSGSFAASGDMVYRYNGDLTILLPSNRKTGRFYVAVSKDEITPSKTTGCTSEEEVQGITFDATPAWEHLQDIYSTPYNYYVGTTATYYGTVSDFASNVPQANLLLYHVAAKVDIQWQVSDDLQAAGYYIDNTNGITVTGLKTKNCLLFKPNENVGVGDNPDTHQITINPGNQWIGRHSFYAIPYATGTDTGDDKKYTISMTVNGAGYNAGAKNLTVSVPYYSTTEPFTQWIRTDVNIKKNE